MSDRQAIAKAASDGLRLFAASIDQRPVLVGFDGFVDSIIHIVDKRYDAERFDRVPTISDFGSRISAAAGQSSNVELVTTVRKLGGNGPIMANALASVGFPTTYIGALGLPAVDPVFDEFAKLATVHSIADPGFTDALEFEDGKLMLGKHDAIRDLSQDAIDEHVGRNAYEGICLHAKLIAMVNWTMLPGMNGIWRHLIDHVLPELDGNRMVFIDLADPAKRTDDDLRAAMALAGELQQDTDVVLGFNLSEATQVASVLGIKVPEDAEPAIEETAAALRESIGVHCVVVHPRRGAAGAIQTNDGVVTATFAGPFVKKPKLSTGAGDNFNAGFCTGLLAGLPLEQALCTGTGVSGFYVREGRSPTLGELADFCADLPAPQ
ncbi:MAG: PfkB family carbohydrate kinase [Planctomycetota bacterium]